jgi:hypothetical protein
MLAGLLVLAAHACEGQTPTSAPTLRIALRADLVRSDQPTSYLTPGDTFGLVARRPNLPAVILVAVRASDAVAAFRQALDERRLPVTSPIVEIPLPTRPPDQPPGPTEFDIVFFADRNENGTWDEGEPFVVSWTGGRGGYRLAYFADAPRDIAGAVPGWNLIEGGMPPLYHGQPATIVVYLYPVIEPLAEAGRPEAK